MPLRSSFPLLTLKRSHLNHLEGNHDLHKKPCNKQICQEAMDDPKKQKNKKTKMA